MDWYKLSDDEITDFLKMYNRDNPQDKTFTSKVITAQALFEEINSRGGRVTDPVRDLYIASLVKNTTRKYTPNQILSLSGDIQKQFAALLFLDPKEPNLNDHILRILNWAGLL